MARRKRVTINGELYDFDDAEKDVVIQRTLLNIWKGVPGYADKCMNAQCIIENKSLFPHPVLAASVRASRVFIIDRPGHAVRYLLNKKDRELIHQHDEVKVGQPGTLHLYAPMGKQRRGQDTGSGRTGRNTGQFRDPPLPRGEEARLRAAVGALK